MSTPLLRRASRRFLLRHPWQSALAVLGIAGGVAAVTGIDLTGAGAQRAFALSVEAVAGPAGFEIARAGGTLDERWYVTARSKPGRPSMAPWVEGWIEILSSGQRVRLIGIDPLAASVSSPQLAGGAGTLTAQQDHAWLGRDVAPGAAVGDRIEARLPTGEASLIVAGRFASGTRQAEALAKSLVVDIATAQELLGLVGRLSRIDVLVPGTADPATPALEALRADLPPGATLRAKAERTAMLGEMTQAFRLNLRALSWLALLVGGFLVYSTMAFTVVRRRAWIGAVRALGVHRAEVGRLVIGEALMIGLVGTALGLAGGSLLARGLMALVLRTINDLYFTLEVAEATVLGPPLVKSAILGLSMSAVAALLPAWEAMKAPPRRAQLRSERETKAVLRLPLVTLSGVFLLATARFLIVYVPRGLGAGFLAVLAAVLGAALLVPGATVLLMRGLAPILGRTVGVLGRLAARGVVAGLSRTGVAMAALVVATAAATGIGIMVHSFRTTVIAWLDVTLQADFYASPSDRSRVRRATLPAAAVDILRATPGVAYTTTTFRGTLGSPTGPLPVIALDTVPEGWRIFRLVEGRRLETYEALEQGGVMIGVPLAYRLGLGIGDTVALDTMHGRALFPIAGVFDDFASDRGTVVFARATFDRFFEAVGVHSIGLFAAPGVDRRALAARLDEGLARLGLGDRVAIVPNSTIRDLSLAIFDRTFEITAVLRVIAVAIAFLGVVSSLMALELDRRRERAVLRALGLTPRQLGALVTAQNLLMGLCAGILAAPVGVLLAWFLVHVINRRAFGWTLQLSVPPVLLLQGLALALAAAALAGVVPTRLLARASPVRALREE